VDAVVADELRSCQYARERLEAPTAEKNWLFLSLNG